MKKIFAALLFLVTLLSLAQTQEIPTGKYINGEDYFNFLPGQRVEFRFSNEACVPAEYKGIGSYVLEEGHIVFNLDPLVGSPDTLVRKVHIAAPTGISKIHVTNINGPLKGAAVQVVDKDRRTLVAQVTDEEGNAYIKIPEKADGVAVNLIEYEMMRIRNLSAKFNYEVFMEKPAGYQYTKSYLNVTNGGLQYKFTNGTFSLNRMNFSCMSGINALQWYTYKTK